MTIEEKLIITEKFACSRCRDEVDVKVDTQRSVESIEINWRCACDGMDDRFHYETIYVER